MKQNTQRITNALLVALTLVLTLIGSAYAQRGEPIDVAPAQIQAPDGRPVIGRHVAFDDLVLVCPLQPLAVENHPCNEGSLGEIDRGRIDDYHLVCPIKEVRDPNHPCFGRSGTAELQQTVDDLKLVCPFEKLADPEHPCNQDNVSTVRFSIADDFKLVCPIKEVLDPDHPCFDD